jgi:hypothetical protein
MRTERLPDHYPGDAAQPTAAKRDRLQSVQRGICIPVPTHSDQTGERRC